MAFLLTKGAILAAIMFILGFFLDEPPKTRRPFSMLTNPRTSFSGSLEGCDCQLITKCLSSVRSNALPRFCGFEGIQRKICCDTKSGNSSDAGKNPYLSTAREQANAAQFYRNQFLYDKDKIRITSGEIDGAGNPSRTPTPVISNRRQNDRKLPDQVDEGSFNHFSSTVSPHEGADNHSSENEQLADSERTDDFEDDITEANTEPSGNTGNDNEALKAIQKQAGKFLSDYFPDYFTDLVKNLTQNNNVSFVDNVPVLLNNSSENISGSGGEKNETEAEKALRKLFSLEDGDESDNGKGNDTKGIDTLDFSNIDLDELLNMAGLGTTGSTKKVDSTSTTSSVSDEVTEKENSRENGEKMEDGHDLSVLTTTPISETSHDSKTEVSVVKTATSISISSSKVGSVSSSKDSNKPEKVGNPMTVSVTSNGPELIKGVENKSEGNASKDDEIDKKSEAENPPLHLETATKAPSTVSPKANQGLEVTTTTASLPDEPDLKVGGNDSSLPIQDEVTTTSHSETLPQGNTENAELQSISTIPEISGIDSDTKTTISPPAKEQNAEEATTIVPISNLNEPDSHSEGQPDEEKHLHETAKDDSHPVDFPSATEKPEIDDGKVIPDKEKLSEEMSPETTTSVSINDLGLDEILTTPISTQEEKPLAENSEKPQLTSSNDKSITTTSSSLAPESDEETTTSISIPSADNTVSENTNTAGTEGEPDIIVTTSSSGSAPSGQSLLEGENEKSEGHDHNEIRKGDDEKAENISTEKSKEPKSEENFETSLAKDENQNMKESLTESHVISSEGTTTTENSTEEKLHTVKSNLEDMTTATPTNTQPSNINEENTTANSSEKTNEIEVLPKIKFEDFPTESPAFSSPGTTLSSGSGSNGQSDLEDMISTTPANVHSTLSKEEKSNDAVSTEKSLEESSEHPEQSSPKEQEEKSKVEDVSTESPTFSSASATPSSDSHSNDAHSNLEDMISTTPTNNQLPDDIEDAKLNEIDEDLNNEVVKKLENISTTESSMKGGETVSTQREKEYDITEQPVATTEKYIESDNSETGVSKETTTQQPSVDTLNEEKSFHTTEKAIEVNKLNESTTQTTHEGQTTTSEKTQEQTMSPNPLENFNSNKEQETTTLSISPVKIIGKGNEASQKEEHKLSNPPNEITTTLSSIINEDVTTPMPSSIVIPKHDSEEMKVSLGTTISGLSDKEDEHTTLTPQMTSAKPIIPEVTESNFFTTQRIVDAINDLETTPMSLDVKMGSDEDKSLSTNTSSKDVPETTTSITTTHQPANESLDEPEISTAKPSQNEESGESIGNDQSKQKVREDMESGNPEKTDPPIEISTTPYEKLLEMGENTTQPNGKIGDNEEENLKGNEKTVVTTTPDPEPEENEIPEDQPNQIPSTTAEKEKNKIEEQTVQQQSTEISVGLEATTHKESSEEMASEEKHPESTETSLKDSEIKIETTTTSTSSTDLDFKLSENSNAANSTTQASSSDEVPEAEKLATTTQFSTNDETTTTSAPISENGEVEKMKGLIMRELEKTDSMENSTESRGGNDSATVSSHSHEEKGEAMNLHSTTISSNSVEETTTNKMPSFDFDPDFKDGDKNNSSLNFMLNITEIFPNKSSSVNESMTSTDSDEVTTSASMPLTSPRGEKKLDLTFTDSSKKPENLNPTTLSPLLNELEFVPDYPDQFLEKGESGTKGQTTTEEPTKENSTEKAMEAPATRTPDEIEMTTTEWQKQALPSTDLSDEPEESMPTTITPKEEDNKTTKSEKFSPPSTTERLLQDEITTIETITSKLDKSFPENEVTKEKGSGESFSTTVSPEDEETTTMSSGKTESHPSSAEMTIDQEPVPTSMSGEITTTELTMAKSVELGLHNTTASDESHTTTVMPIETEETTQGSPMKEEPSSGKNPTSSLPTEKYYTTTEDGNKEEETVSTTISPKDRDGTTSMPLIEDNKSSSSAMNQNESSSLVTTPFPDDDTTTERNVKIMNAIMSHSNLTTTTVSDKIVSTATIEIPIEDENESTTKTLSILKETTILPDFLNNETHTTTIFSEAFTTMPPLKMRQGENTETTSQLPEPENDEDITTTTISPSPRQATPIPNMYSTETERSKSIVSLIFSISASRTKISRNVTETTVRNVTYHISLKNETDSDFHPISTTLSPTTTEFKDVDFNDEVIFEENTSTIPNSGMDVDIDTEMDDMTSTMRTQGDMTTSTMPGTTMLPTTEFPGESTTTESVPQDHTEAENSTESGTQKASNLGFTTTETPEIVTLPSDAENVTEYVELSTTANGNDSDSFTTEIPVSIGNFTENSTEFIQSELTTKVPTTAKDSASQSQEDEDNFDFVQNTTISVITEDDTEKQNSSIPEDFADLFTSHSKTPNSSLLLEVLTNSFKNTSLGEVKSENESAKNAEEQEDSILLSISTGRGNRSLTPPEAVEVAQELGKGISNVVNQLLLTSHKNFHLLPQFTDCATAKRNRRKSKVLNLEYEHLPHVVRIGVMEPGGLVYSCAGTLISRQYVLTSAYCLENKFPVTTILIEDELNNKHYEEIESIKIHPSFSNLTLYNDIALIRLKKAMPEVKPICLPFEDAYGIWESVGQTPGETATLSGWTKRLKSVDMNETSVDIIPDNRCTNVFKSQTVPSQICTASPTSFPNYFTRGSPLTTVMTRHKLFFQIGFLSHYNDNAQLHTRLTSYLQWILDSLEE